MVGTNGFYALKAHWSEHPERDEEWAQQEKSRIGDERFRREHDCEFIAFDATLRHRPVRIENLISKIHSCKKIAMADCSNMKDAINAIKIMEVRGAPLIGGTAAYGLVLAVQENNDPEFIKKSAKELIQSRPTAINLKWAVDRMIKKLAGISRREVLVGSAAGAGLVIGYSVLPNAVDSASKAIAAGNWDHQQYLTMDTDGKAYVYVTKCELGQHVGTALAQAVAEELEINWDDVNVIYPDSHAKWGLMITGGSWSVNWTFDRNSRIGASARIALVEAGAKMMGASVSDCYAKNSVVYSNSGSSVTYKNILSKNTIDRTFSEEEIKSIKLKSFGEYSIVGQSKMPLDLPAKLDGSAKYGTTIPIFLVNSLF